MTDDVLITTRRTPAAHKRADDAPHQRYPYIQSVRITPRQKQIALRWARGERGACTDDQMRALIRYLLGDK